jgi:membrane-associated phospholipid phosphatase
MSVRLRWLPLTVVLLAFSAPALSQTLESPPSLFPKPALFSDLFAGQDEAKPATPEHTGLAALVVKTGEDFKAFPQRASTWVILGFGAAGALALHPVDDDANARLVGNHAWGHFFAPGKWVGSAWAEAGASIGLYVVGRYVMPHPGGVKTNRVSHLGFDLLRAQIVSQVLVQATKIAVRRDRPTGECCSFPSGHAATAFATASVLERHLGYRAAVPTMLMASYVAVSRLHDNRHFVSDVVFGSAIGIASGWTVVGRHGRSDYALLPVPTKGGAAIMLTRVNADAR